MQSKRGRLDRFLSRHLSMNRKDVRLFLAQKRVFVDGVVALDIEMPVDEFSRIVVDKHRVLQANEPVYIMMYKPVGVVSATKDDQHRTVIDLLDRPDKAALHIVGRLDLNTSGLLLLTNDGRWSRQLTSPESKVTKSYRVTLQNSLEDEYINAFSQGMYFSYEDITTEPAGLEIISEHVAHVSLTEGRYHQIKRMFGRFRNPVLQLHRMSIGCLSLDMELMPGESRDLTSHEVESIHL